MGYFDDTIPEFDYDILLDNYSKELCYFPCLSEWDICVLLSLLRFGDFPSRWRGSSDSPDGPAVVYLRNSQRDEELSSALGDIETLRSKLIMATCGQEIKDGLLAIAEALAAMQPSVVTQSVNCGGTTVNVANYIQGVTSSGQPVYGTVPGNAGPPEGEGQVPEGWEGTYEEWLAHKCQAANLIVDALIASMRGLAVLDIAFLIQSGLAASLIAGAIVAGVTVPPLAIAGLIAVIIGLGASLTYLEGIADEWASDRDNFVCSLYNSGNAAAAIDVVEEYIDEALGAIAVAAPLHPAIRTIGLILASTDTINQLFEVGLPVAYPNADCSGCGEVLAIASTPTATFTSLGDGVWQVDAPARYSEQYNFWESYVYADPTAVLVLTDASLLSGNTPDSTFVVLKYSDGSQTSPGGWAQRAGVYNEELWKEFNQRSSADFTVRWIVHLLA